MKKLISIGEAIIDFIPDQKGVSIKNVENFSPKVGGAPLNVCGVYSLLGGNSMFISKLGLDYFGDKVIDTMQEFNISTSGISRTDKANTSLAFVGLDAHGDRQFSFYRNPGADMLLESSDINKDWFVDCGILHFCSVSLSCEPVKSAHRRAIELTKRNGGIVSFDLNIRMNLWKDKDELKSTIEEFIQYADIVKLSDDEIEFMASGMNPNRYIEKLLDNGVKLVLLTKGKNGASGYTKIQSVHVDGIDVVVNDTTGAGDAFIGSFLACFSEHEYNKKDIELLTHDEIKELIEFAVSYSAVTVQNIGALSSYKTKEEFFNIKK